MTGHHRAANKSAAVVVAQMVVCVVGIYTCFGVWSLKQERVITQSYTLADGTLAKFRFPFVINAFQNFFSLLVAAGLLVLSGERLWPSSTVHQESSVDGSKGGKRNTGERHWVQSAAIIGFNVSFASPFGYRAMAQLSYPIVLTVKMCKMVPVVLIGSMFYRAYYSFEKYATVALITLGVLLFSFLEEKSETSGEGARESSSLTGLLLIFINLMMDGFTCSTQDQLVKRLHWSGNRVMFITNLSACTMTFLALMASEVLPLNTIVRPELTGALAFFQAAPTAFMDVLIMGVLNAAGQCFIFQTIALFGSLTVTAMTLIRKVGSVLLSIYINQHAVSLPQWISLMLVLAGIVLETKINIQEKSKHSGTIKSGKEASFVNGNEQDHAAAKPAKAKSG